ncbi:HSP20-like chaperone [Gloeopeniophorella convolvens]|nr:HSP20-like chaperone [Gloeopeniophorella convolvens]
MYKYSYPYVQLVVAHRRRLAATQHGVASSDPMRPRVEICDEPQSRYVTATFELPGLKKEEIGVHLTQDGRLTISGDRRPPAFLTNADPSLPRYPVRELKYGRFERTINIPAGLEVKDINASLADGMLSVSWPRPMALGLSQVPTHVVGMA